MSDYSKLTNYLSEQNGSASSSGADKLASAKSSVTSFFKQNILGETKDNSRAPSSAEANAQTDSWFKDADSDPYCPQMSRKQRVIGFMLCIIMGAFCMGLASFYIPVIVLKSRKFVLLFSMGSVFFIASFSMLWGLKKHMTHLIALERLPFTLAYFGTLTGTIYYSMIVQSVLLTLIFAALQMITLFWYIFSHLPGGVTGFKVFAKMLTTVVTKTASATLPV